MLTRHVRIPCKGSLCLTNTFTLFPLNWQDITFKYLILCGNQLISMPKLLMSLCLLFWGKYSNKNYIGWNCLLGHKKKIAKFLLRTSTCRSTFLYGFEIRALTMLTRHVWIPCKGSLCLKHIFTLFPLNWQDITFGFWTSFVVHTPDHMTPMVNFSQIHIFLVQEFPG